MFFNRLKKVDLGCFNELSCKQLEICIFGCGGLVKALSSSEIRTELLSFLPETHQKPFILTDLFNLGLEGTREGLLNTLRTKGF